jgi:hypothetical protein
MYNQLLQQQMQQQMQPQSGGNIPDNQMPNSGLRMPGSSGNMG